MFVEKSEIEIIHLEQEIFVVGLNLQSSGLPIAFDSLGKMWERYTKDMKQRTPNCLEDLDEYGVCLNKVPDYIVGTNVSSIVENLEGYYSVVIPKGDYIKATFNAQNHESLVEEKLMQREKEAKSWAKKNKTKIDGRIMVEVYPTKTIEQEYPEMYVLIPIA